MRFSAKHLKPFWNKKNILFVSLLLIFAIGLGATTAWLSDYKGAPNYEFEGASVQCATQLTLTNASTVAKVKNTSEDDIPVYIRAHVLVHYRETDSTEGLHWSYPILNTDYKIEYNLDDWIQASDGFFYYKYPVIQGESTGNLIQSFSLINGGNPPAGYEFRLEVLGNAIQALPDTTPAIDAWGNIGSLEQVVSPNAQPQKTLETNILTLNIRNSGAQHDDGTFAADKGNGEWTQRRGYLAQYLRGSERDIICLQDVSQYQHEYLRDHVNTEDSNLTYGFAYWSFRASEHWYRGLLTMYDVNRYEYLNDSYVLVPFSESGSADDLTFVDNSLSSQPYHYRGALITRFREKTTGYVIAVCNVQADYPADDMVGLYSSTQAAKVDALRTMGVKRALEKLYQQNADFYMMAGDFTADAYREPSWYDSVIAKMQNVLPGETQKTLNNWEDKYEKIYQLESPTPNDVTGPVDFIFVDKTTQVFRDAGDTGVLEASYNNGADLYSRHYAVGAKVKFKRY